MVFKGLTKMTDLEKYAFLFMVKMRNKHFMCYKKLFIRLLCRFSWKNMKQLEERLQAKMDLYTWLPWTPNKSKCSVIKLLPFGIALHCTSARDAQTVCKRKHCCGSWQGYPRPSWMEQEWQGKRLLEAWGWYLRGVPGLSVSWDTSPQGLLPLERQTLVQK